jgi:hypothetical protein
MSGVYKAFMRKFAGKRPFGRLRCRWEGNMKWILKNVECVE